MKKRYLLFLLIAALFLAGYPNIEPNRGNTISNASEDQQEPLEPVVLASFELVQPLPEVPERMVIYKTIAPSILREDIQALMETFGLEGQITDRQRQFVVKDGDKVLEIFKQPGTGYLRFSDNAKLAIEESAKNLLSEDEAIRKAEEFLKDHSLLPENTFFAGVGYYEFRKYNSDGETIAQGKSALAVGFGFEIEGMKVEGPGAKAGVVFGEDGEIIGASRIWREIEPDKEMRIITPKEALANFKQWWPREADPEELEEADVRTEVSIRETYMAYYAEPGCESQDYIEPVYVFKGDYKVSGRIGEQEIQDSDSFQIIVPAISGQSS
jgi:hypothetical protein